MVVAAGSIVKDSVLYIGSVLLNGITDPQSGTRASTDSRFVATVFPERSLLLPVILVQGRVVNAEKLGTSNNSMRVNIAIDTTVFAKKRYESDQLADAVFQRLRLLQTASGGTEETGLLGFSPGARVQTDEEGRDGNHITRQEFNYFVVV